MGNRLLDEFAYEYKHLLEAELRKLVDRLEAPPIIKKAMHYSLDAGGKRIRPLLLFATLAAFGIDPKKGLLAAAAVEMIHTYSLIHDDLPSMDDDDYRRGKLTNHKVFGEATAILAGDALLTYSFEVLGMIPNEAGSSDTKLKLMVEFAKAGGAEGMVGGQVADMEGENKELSIEELEYIHIHKTGKLLGFSVHAGALLAHAEEDQLENLRAFAHHLGLAFQIQDDILDLEGNPELLGKPVGSDASNHKSTYPQLLTMDGAKKALHHHIDESKRYLKRTGLNTSLLIEITDLVASRDH
ncbi:polyprenyl synthetase family protein [Bacillus salipaludis]|uniref:Farnesyl diphosphate synthase n=1 Tax=Bacillus salipaludis TaxID=2547811 RepID=A0A4R5VPC6_9BACI|nr:farnesyl diphosphate synthase [Bacillus salipaludis]MDQ6599588.1 polyprenyl synthetase family protein [Bacillus salipaludis]TDK60145.1 polyprenyl synthetase family protein [Bacillus salipaludis]